MNKKHRVFIAINLPERIKSALADYQNKWSRSQIDRGSSTGSGPELPARWTKTENIHITLVFIGYVEEQQILEIIQVVQKVVEQQKSFSIRLEKIIYGPPKISPPRMVWVMAKKSEEFNLLCDKLNKVLLNLPKINFKPERREITPHITLARIKEWEWRRIEPDERPEIEEYVNFEIPVKSIEIMESVLKRPGPEYRIIESIPFIRN